MDKKYQMIKSFALLAILFFVDCGFVFSAGKGTGQPGVIGSKRCGKCHKEIYDMWKLTPHANMLIDAKKNPDKILANYFPEKFTFSKEDVYYTLGSHRLQKYLTVLDDEQIYQLPKVWNIIENDWEPYSIFDWRDKPYLTFCVGCHTVGFNQNTNTFLEGGVGCEACHGAGMKHAASEDASDIVNPDKLTKELRDMICEQCHTDGDSVNYPGTPFPVGYKPGDDITEYYSAFFMPKPGSKKWYWGTKDYKERHRMFKFWQTQFLYYRLFRTCDVCSYDSTLFRFRKKEQTFDYKSARKRFCRTCHREKFENYTKHSQHLESTAICTDCHLTKLSPNKERYSIHDHKFDFSQPESECTECHYNVDTDEEIKGQDPLYFHAERRFFKKGSAKRAKYKLCEYCHYNINDIHAAKHGGTGETCSKCHFNEDNMTGELFYKHSFDKATLIKTKVFEDMCKLCHYTVPVYKHHKSFMNNKIKIKVDGPVKSTCENCHEPTIEKDEIIKK
jgi:hypothetical protein